MEDVQFITYMSRSCNKTVITAEIKTFVINFYNSVACECPYKKSAALVEGQRQPFKFFEKTLSEYFHTFKQENPTVKIGHTSFENLQPKNIKLKSQAQHQVCCCIQHVNIDYLHTKLNELSQMNNQPIIPDNEILVSKTVCRSDDITCIKQLCKNCRADLLNEVSDTIKYCSYDYQEKQEECSNHTAACHQFRKADYTNKKGEAKKKLALVTDCYIICGLFRTLKATMIFFPRHRYNNAYTKEVYKQAINNVCPGQMIKVEDFSKNYTCLVPDELQSLHWSQTQVTLFPAVTFYKDINGNLLEDHLVYVLDDKKHDCAFLELVYAKIHEYYKQKGVQINLDIEFNNGCAFQFKSIKSFGCLQNTKSTLTEFILNLPMVKALLMALEVW